VAQGKVRRTICKTTVPFGPSLPEVPNLHGPRWGAEAVLPQRAEWDAAQLRKQVTDWPSVDVRKARRWLEFLKANNALYHDVVVADDARQLWTGLAGLPEKLCSEAAVLDDAVCAGMAEAAGQSLNAAVASKDAASAAQPGLAPADPQAPPPPPQPPPPTPPP
jgi:hypothetical protein